METRQTLASMFEVNKQALVKELTGLSLPKDANKVQSLVADYFNTLFAQNGEFRQSLSLSEDYILQAALSLLNAQQAMGRQLTEKEIVIKTKISYAEKENESETKQIEQKEGISTIHKTLSQKLDSSKALIGSGGGAVLGKLALSSGWGAVFGAIAGTAIVLYLASTSKVKDTVIKEKLTSVKPNMEASVVNYGIDVTAFLNIIKQTCDSIDSLIKTFRNQIKRVVDKYESQDKPTLENEYGVLLESIQSLLGVAYSQQRDEKRLAKIDERLEQLVDSLENYGLEVVVFSEDKINWFEQLESTKVTVPTMICPAIVKNGELVKRGKVFMNNAI